MNYIKILEQIHNKKIVHRDIKPHNFLIKNKKLMVDLIII